jgi:hypothetical protein
LDDSATPVFIYAGFASDTIIITDTIFSNEFIVEFCSDSLLFTEAVQDNSSALASASDIISFVDVGAGYAGWDPIPNPNPGWSPIEPGAGSSWAPIPSASSTWTPIGNS